MLGAGGGIAFGLELGDVEVDLCAEVDAAFADGHADALEGEVAVLFGVADDDGGAVAADELVEAHVFEVASVREVEEGSLVVDHADEFGQQVEETEPGGGGIAPRFEAEFLVTRIANPEAEADVEDGQQEGHGGTGVIARVGADGCAGCGYGGSHVGPSVVEGEVTGWGVAVELDAGGVGLGPAYVVAAVERGEREGGGLALLIGEVLPEGEVEGGAEDGKRPLIRR